MKRPVIAILLLVLFGALRLPLEHKLTQEHRAAYFHTANLNLSLRAQIGQFGFLAALSGFRALVADVLWLQAFTAWEHTQWGRMALLFNSVVALQPRETMFWDMAAWHMAWNASVAALNDPKQPSETLRIKAAHEYYRLGEDYLLRGIQNNPDRYELYERLGTLYKEKFKDHCKAAEMYQKAATFSKAPTYEIRFVGYELAACPGHEREAYELLRKLYLQSQNEWLPSLLSTLAELQEKLHVPASERVYNPPPTAPTTAHPHP
jgi:tetratricopeptide (TPR) repeat protein